MFVEEDKVVWEIQLQESRWHIFPEEVSQSLEDMYSVNSRNTFLIKTNDISWVHLHTDKLWRLRMVLIKKIESEIKFMLKLQIGQILSVRFGLCQNKWII